MADFYRASASFTRPNDTTAYTAGDLVANSTTAGSVAMMTFAFDTAGSGRPLWLRRIKITKSDPDVTNSSFRLWLHNDSAVTFTNGDNGALSIATSTLAIGSIILTSDLVIAASLAGSGDVLTESFDRGVHILPTTTYGFLEARAGYTPGAQEVFAVELLGEPA